MERPEDMIRQKLAERQAKGTYRALKPESGLADFCSNDYLGFARSAILNQKVENEITSRSTGLNGSTGSRLLSGNLSYTENLERDIAKFHNAEAALIYNSGYDANVGLFSCLPQKGDTIITDELIHASIIDGARLSFANRYSFRHNDLQSLEEKLRNAKGRCYIAVESVYSMDGDSPPLPEMLNLAEAYGASVIVDEAHAVGLNERGLLCQLEIENRVFARIVTFGKALGCHGAVILGSNPLREYLVNFSRSFIYTTAAPFHQLAAIRMAYQMLPNSGAEVDKLKKNIARFKNSLQGLTGLKLLPSDSAIQSLIIGCSEKTKMMAVELQAAGLDVRPILSPTVPAGTERLRVILHSFNTSEELILLADTLIKISHAG
ncbi:MAG TPA: pyridoxal phosphate-dependent aminotransferase family protein [Mucilaginibacter sp.]|nr:pyridoxal phosphate-dependent aminotransferase family protein [Mucilaginibacter sp.]